MLATKRPNTVSEPSISAGRIAFRISMATAVMPIH